MKTIQILKGTIVVLLSLVLAVLLIPRFTGVQYLAVTSGSMEPEIPVGSLVVVIPTQADKIVVDDDITFKIKSGALVTHRVVEIDAANKQVITRGIANDADLFDAPVGYENIQGVVRLTIPRVGRYISYLNNSMARVLIIAWILAIAFVYAALSLFYRMMKKKKTDMLDPLVLPQEDSEQK